MDFYEGKLLALFDIIKRKKKTVVGNLDFKTLDGEEHPSEELVVPDERTGDVGLSSQEGYCQNCHAPLAGKFCSECGQVDKELRRPFWFLLWDLSDDLLSWDSRILKTLGPLLFLPGLLTRTFMDGQRARYVPPIRLFIISSIFFFLVVTITNVAIIKFVVTEVPLEQLSQRSNDALTISKATLAARRVEMEADGIDEEEAKELEQLQRAVNALEQRPLEQKVQNQDIAAAKEQQKQWLEQQVEGLANAFAEGLIPSRERYRELLDELIAENLATSEQALKVKEVEPLAGEAEAEGEVDEEGYYIPPKPNLPTAGGEGPSITVGNNRDWQIEWFVPMEQDSNAPKLDEDQFQGPIDEIQKEIDDLNAKDDKGFWDGIGVIALERVQKAMVGFQTAVQDPEKLNDVLNDWVPRAMIILLPIFAILLKIFYWGRANCFVTQLVFSLHFHTYIFLVISFLIIAQYFLGAAASSWMFFAAVPLYMFIGLKYASSNGWIKTIFKFPIIGLTYFLLFIIVMTFTVIWGLGGV